LDSPDLRGFRSNRPVLILTIPTVSVDAHKIPCYPRDARSEWGHWGEALMWRSYGATGRAKASSHPYSNP